MATAPIKMRHGRVAVSDLVVRKASDNKRALATVEKLMSRDRTPVEDDLLEILSNEIERFESSAYERSTSAPEEVLQFLLEQNGQSAKDIEELVGGRSHASEILSGKRSIGLRVALRLGEHFNISPAAFLTFR